MSNQGLPKRHNDYSVMTNAERRHALMNKAKPDYFKPLNPHDGQGIPMEPGLVGAEMRNIDDIKNEPAIEKDIKKPRKPRKHSASKT